MIIIIISHRLSTLNYDEIFKFDKEKRSNKIVMNILVTGCAGFIDILLSKKLPILNIRFTALITLQIIMMLG